MNKHQFLSSKTNVWAPSCYLLAHEKLRDSPRVEAETSHPQRPTFQHGKKTNFPVYNTFKDILLIKVKDKFSHEGWAITSFGTLKTSKRIG